MVVYFVMEYLLREGSALAPLEMPCPKLNLVLEPASWPAAIFPSTLAEHPGASQLQIPLHNAAGLRQAATRKGCLVKASCKVRPFFRHLRSSTCCLRCYPCSVRWSGREGTTVWSHHPRGWQSATHTWGHLRPRLPSGRPPMNPQNPRRNIWRVSRRPGTDSL